MVVKLWIKDKSPKALIEELRIKVNPNATLWDAFNDYSAPASNDYFIYQKINLACSNTFFGFNDDAGSLSYEEQESFAHQKFEDYKKEISELLKHSPDKNLQPCLNLKNMEANNFWDIYYEFIEANPLMNEFQGHFAAWMGDEKVLFLSLNKEDKELPFHIDLGGLSLSKYKEILEKYNGI